MQPEAARSTCQLASARVAGIGGAGEASAPIATPGPGLAPGAGLAALRLLQVGVIFMIVYTAANHLTSLRGDIGAGVFDWERAIPFVEWTVVPYLSIFLLLPLSFFVCSDVDELNRHARRLLLALALAVACYAAFPLGFHFERPQPQGPFAPMFELLWAVDLPYNRAPSLHIVTLQLMWPLLIARLNVSWQRVLVHAWLAAIGISVLTTYQHHVIDILGGSAVAGTCTLLMAGRARRASRRTAVRQAARYCQLIAARSLAKIGTSFQSPFTRALATVIQVGWYR